MCDDYHQDCHTNVREGSSKRGMVDDALLGPMTVTGGTKGPAWVVELAGTSASVEAGMVD